MGVVIRGSIKQRVALEGLGDAEFDGTAMSRLRCRPVRVEASYSEGTNFELFGGE